MSVVMAVVDIVRNLSAVECDGMYVGAFIVGGREEEWPAEWVGSRVIGGI